MIHLGECQPQTWYAVFCPAQAGEPLPWWLRLVTSPGYRHVFLLQDLDGVAALMIDTPKLQFWSDVMPAPALEVAKQFSAIGFPVLRMRSTVTYHYHFPSPFTCVNLAKSALGVQDWRIWTPKQLHGALLARGAEDIC